MPLAYHPLTTGLAAIAGAKAPIYLMVDGLPLMIDGQLVLFSE